MLNAMGEPLDRASRRGRRDLAPKHPLVPPGKIMKNEPMLWPLFTPRPPLKYVGTLTKRKCLPLTGMAEFLDRFSKKPPPDRVVQLTVKQRREQKAKAKKEAHAQSQQPKVETYRKRQQQLSSVSDTSESAEAKGNATTETKAESADSPTSSTLPENYTKNPLHTLFVARLPFDITERKLITAFSKYGPIVKVCLVKNRDGESRGMAFIEFEEEADMRKAYHQADATKLGKNLDGKDLRIVVDVERGRTVRDWLPRRLGGGLGGTRRGGVRDNDRVSGRPGSDRGRAGGAGNYRANDRSRYNDRRPSFRDSRREPPRSYNRDRDRPRDRDRDRDRARDRDRDRDRTRDRDRDRDRDRTRRDRDRDRTRSDRKDRDRDRRSYRDDDRDRKRSRGGH